MVQALHVHHNMIPYSIKTLCRPQVRNVHRWVLWILLPIVDTIADCINDNRCLFPIHLSKTVTVNIHSSLSATRRRTPATPHHGDRRGHKTSGQYLQGECMIVNICVILQNSGDINITRIHRQTCSRETHQVTDVYESKPCSTKGSPAGAILARALCRQQDRRGCICMPAFGVVFFCFAQIIARFGRPHDTFSRVHNAFAAWGKLPVMFARPQSGFAARIALPALRGAVCV